MKKKNNKLPQSKKNLNTTLFALTFCLGGIFFGTIVSDATYATFIVKDWEVDNILFFNGVVIWLYSMIMFVFFAGINAMLNKLNKDETR